MLVIADDLTGATDTAGAMAASGRTCVVSLTVNASLLSADVLVIDTDGRARSAAEACAATAEAVRQHQDRAAPLFIKVDSTLRGHVRATVEAAVAALDVSPAHVVICPAFPRHGRAVVDGQVLVHGVPLAGPTLHELFDGFAPYGVRTQIPDAVTDDDLAAIVAASSPDTVWVGSAGLAHHVARLTSDQRERPNSVEHPGPSHNIVVVAGSLQQRTAEQVAHLGAESLEDVRYSVEVIVKNPLDPPFDALVVQHATRADGLVLTGGATARAVLELLHITSLTVCGEIEPGVPWCVASGPSGPVTVVTKAGGFGDERTLQRAVLFLAGS
jgi:uncharacterized protein YgbK (DUF1537 family)